MTFTKYAYLKSLHGKEVKPTHYRVLVTLLDYANADGSRARPGVESLARDCCIHAETVKQALRWLRENGYIIETHRGRKHGGASCYSFPVTAQGSLDTSLTANLREVKNGEIPASQGSPQASPPKEDQKLDASLPSNGSGLSVTSGPGGAAVESSSEGHRHREIDGHPERPLDSRTEKTSALSSSANDDGAWGTPSVGKRIEIEAAPPW